MAGLIIFVLVVIAFGIARLVGDIPGKKRSQNTVIPVPKQRFEIPLKDCRVISKTDYYDPEPSRHERLDALFGMDGDPASKKIRVVLSWLEYEIRHSEGVTKLVSAPILIDEASLRMKMFGHKTTTIDIYDIGNGEEEFVFNLDFLNN